MPTPPAIAPRKRPRQARAAATVAAVIEAAAHILEAEGLNGFNTNAVAARAGVSIGSLYQYFPGKDAILAALIRQEAEAFDAALTQAVARTGELGTTGAVALLARVAVRHQASRPRLARLLDLEEQRLGLGREADAAGARTAATIARFLAERRLGGEEAALDILHMARGLIDGALDRGAVENLEQRLAWAILGYLALSRQAPSA
ncbi:MAG TPA: helix-turn-helix domain-containing protein [Phenylobacterium sp.]|nr:helix-turn-helix domain-containing protein [Phenylobacterium sp.]